MRDRSSGITERVSVGPGGSEADAHYSCCSPPAISADGRFIAFASDSRNLVPGDTSGRIDVFVRDRQSGVTEWVSVGVDGKGAAVYSVRESGGFPPSAQPRLTRAG